MFSAVGFDLGDTLVEYVGVPLNWESHYPRALAAVSELLHLNPDADRLVDAQAVLCEYNTRLNPREQEVDARELFGRLFGTLGCGDTPDDALFERAVDSFFGVFRGLGAPVPGGVEAVSELEASGVSIGVLTDVAYAMPRKLVLDDLAAAGLERLGDVALTSADVGWRKPRSEGFAMLAGLIGAELEAMLYIGNEEKDVVGALRAGAGAALLWRSNETVPQWGQHFTLRSLDELPALFA